MLKDYKNRSLTQILKAELGKAISIMGKPESYLMISLVENQDLYFEGIFSK